MRQLYGTIPLRIDGRYARDYGARKWRGGACPTGRQREEETIRAVVGDITDAFNRHDAKAWIRFATPDAQLVTVRGESMTGFDEIERGLTTLVQGRNRNAKVRVLSLRVKFIRADVALAYVHSELSGVVGPEGQTLPPSRELSVRVFAKDPRHVAHYGFSQHARSVLERNSHRCSASL